MLALLSLVAVTFAAFFDVNQIMGHLGRFYFPVAAVRRRGRRAQRRSLLPAAARGDGPGAGRPAGRSGDLPAGRRLGARRRGRALPGARRHAVAGVARWLPRRRQHPLPELDSWTSSEEIGRFARDAPMGTRFAMSEHGLVGAMAPDAVIIDVLGLHDRDFALHGFRAAELWRRAPDVIWMPHPDHTQMIRDILDSPRVLGRLRLLPRCLHLRGGPAPRRAARGSSSATRFRARWQRELPRLRARRLSGSTRAVSR